MSDATPAPVLWRSFAEVEPVAEISSRSTSIRHGSPSTSNGVVRASRPRRPM